MMSSVFPSWEAFYSFITSVKQVLFLVVDDSFFSCFFPSLAAQALYTISKSWQARLLFNIFTFLYCVFSVGKKNENAKLASVLFCPCSADERFDATFHTNVLVNATGSCQYIPPGEMFTCCCL